MLQAKSEYKKNLQLAYPVMVGSLGQIAVGVADSAMVGQLGAIPLAGVSFANSLLVVPLVFGMGVAYGITPLVANADGENRPHKATRYFKNGLFINTILGILIVGLLLASGRFMNFFGQEPAVVHAAAPYFMVTALSFFPLLIFFTYKQFTEGLSDTKAAMRLSLAANALNILLNWVLIFGHWGIEPMGMVGAAWATLISRTLMALAMLFWVHGRSRYQHYIRYFRREKLTVKRMKEVLAIGVPSGLQYIFEVGAFASAAIIVGMIDALQLAAHQIAISLASISYMAASGFGAAATVRVGNQRGRKDFPALRTAATTLFQMTVAFMILAGIVFLAGRNILPGFFTDETIVIEIAANLLIITTLFQISDGVQVTALGALRGLSDVRMPTWITFFAYWLLALPLGYVLGVHAGFGAIGVWIGLAAGLTASAVALWFRFQHKSRALGGGI